MAMLSGRGGAFSGRAGGNGSAVRSPVITSYDIATKTVSGTAQAGALVRVFKDQAEVGNATANGAGLWSYVFGTAPGAGSVLGAKQTVGVTSGFGNLVIVTPPPVTLGVLGLSTATFPEGAPAGTVIGAILGLSAGSTVTVTPADGRVAISGGNLVVGLTASDLGDFGITLREELAGATNSPRATGLTITCADPLANLRPIAYTSGVPNESGGLGVANKQVGSTFHFVMMEALPDGSFVASYPNWAATAGQGEWTRGAAAQGRCSLIWFDSTRTRRVTQLVGLDGQPLVSCADGKELNFYGPDVTDALPGSHAWLSFWGSFPNGGYYSHGKADYANGDGLVYGTTVPDLTGSTTLYGNSWTGGGDAYGPVFVGGNAARPTAHIDSDSRDGGVLAAGTVSDVPDTLFGHHGPFARLLGPYLALMDLSVPGGTLAEMADPAKTARRDRHAQRSGYRLGGLGVNDLIFQGASAAQVADWETTRAGRIGKTTRYKTIDPATVSQSNNTVANPTRDSERRTRNTALRALTGTIDVASILESSGSPGTWASTTYNSDGTHETSVGNRAAVTGLSGYPVATHFPGAALVDAGVQYPAGAAYQSLLLDDGWGTQQATLTNKGLYSPEHKLTAATIKEDATAGANHAIYKQVTLALASTTKLFTFFVKRSAGTRNLFFMVQRSDFSGDGRSVINLGTGAVIYNNGTAGFTVNSATVTTYDDYLKVVVSMTLAAGMPANPYIFFKMADASGNDSYNGDNASAIAVWGLDIR